MRRLALAFVLLCLAPAAAAASAPERYAFGYLVQYIGLFDLRLDGTIDLGTDGYTIVMQLKTEGMADLATRYRMSARSEGRHASLISATEHESELQSRFIERRTAKVVWDADGYATAEMVPPAKKDGREPVARAMTQGAIDPLSALLAAIIKPGEAAACSGRIPVFDGRRRFDLLPKPVGMADIAPPRAGAFAGQALHCELYVERIAGYSKKDAMVRRPDEPGFEVWLAHRPGLNILVPARIFADTRYGEVVASLVHLEKDGRVVDLQDR